jgi:hypothetical protein
MLKEKQYEVVGIFSSVEALDQAVGELFFHGFDQSSLSILANEESVRQQLKENYKKIDELANNDDLPRTAFYAEENFSIAQGAIIGILMFIGITTSAAMVILKQSSLFLALIITGISVIGSILLARLVAKYHKRYLDLQLKNGGLLLWVQLKDKLLKDKVISILKSNKARNVHLRYIHKNFDRSIP